MAEIKYTHADVDYTFVFVEKRWSNVDQDQVSVLLECQSWSFAHIYGARENLADQGEYIYFVRVSHVGWKDSCAMMLTGRQIETAFPALQKQW